MNNHNLLNNTNYQDILSTLLTQSVNHCQTLNELNDLKVISLKYDKMFNQLNHTKNRYFLGMMNYCYEAKTTFLPTLKEIEIALNNLNKINQQFTFSFMFDSESYNHSWTYFLNTLQYGFHYNMTKLNTFSEIINTYQPYFCDIKRNEYIKGNILDLTITICAFQLNANHDIVSNIYQFPLKSLFYVDFDITTCLIFSVLNDTTFHHNLLNLKLIHKKHVNTFFNQHITNLNSIPYTLTKTITFTNSLTTLELQKLLAKYFHNATWYIKTYFSWTLSNDNHTFTFNFNFDLATFYKQHKTQDELLLAYWNHYLTALVDINSMLKHLKA